MKTQSSAAPFGFIRLSVALLAAMVFCALGATPATAVPLTINIVAVDGNGAPVTAPAGYRWLVEEDRTKLAVPGKPATTANYSFSFHTSYMPVVAAGRVGAPGNADPTDPDVARLYATTPASLNLDASKRYYVSVAAEGFQVGGAPVVFGASGATATVTLIQYPVPTAQISVLVFNDNFPVNNAHDLPQEQGLEGFTIQLLEAGGTYGQSGGQVTQDAFGNPLGTTYSDDQGTVAQRGTGIILTDANGVAFIKNLYPAKYTILIVPRIRPGEDWHQTSTIEGTKGVDAWVKNNEPPGFYEFGPPGYHVFYGFVNAANGGCLQGKNPNGTCVGMNNNNQGASITGRIVSVHDARPPVLAIDTGPPVHQCWVALNNAGTRQGVYTAPCLNTAGHVGEFTIPNVSPGTYELVVWDEPIDTIIGFTTVTVGTANVNLGDIPQLGWFGRYQGRVFQDIDGTGLPYFREAFDRPYVYVNPMTGVEEVRQQNFAAGDLKPALGAGVASNIRFRDGSIYQSTTTKDDGTFAHTEVFPFFNWTVAEIDYARFKATSANIVVDNGGPISAAANLTGLWGKNPTTPYTGLFGSNNPALAYNPWTRINPQPQRLTDGALTDGGLFRMENCAETGGQCAILLEGMSLYANQTNHIEWGKVPYTIEENGGIAGIVYYGITRAEDDPRYAAAENWEPGIPRVQVNVYLDCDGDGIPDRPKNDGSGQCSQLSGSDNYAYDPADVDNYPFCWRDPESCGLTSPQMGPEDFKRVPDAHRAAVAARQANVLGVPVTVDHFLYGDVFRWGAPGVPGLEPDQQKAQTTWGLGKTDAWDDSIPTDCPTRSLTEPPFTIPYGPEAGTALDCWDGLRNWNQLRPAVFDGGFAFGRVAGQAELPMIIGAEGKGTYILEAVAPPGYLHQGNGDKNVVFGDVLASRPAALPHECVGIALNVPEFLTLFPNELNPNFGSPQYPNNKWRKCDMKAVPLLPGLNAAPNFFMFTEAPVAGHGMGLLTDDLNNTMDPLSPNWGEKHAPPDVPISVQDWTGRELQRIYADQFGRYNFLVPSTFTINPPYPSGVMPNMIQACLNHPGPIVDTRPFLEDGVTPNPTLGQLIIDPYFNRRYTQQCYTLQYLPGKTTYLDTPMLPVAAFASVEKTPLDCECENKTPAIYSATNGNNGPWVPAIGGPLTIVSSGLVDVPNPAYDPAIPTSPRTIKRDYGFGTTQGTVTVGGTSLTGISWSDGVITGTVPAMPFGQYQLTIKRAAPPADNGKEAVVGLTVHVGGPNPKTVPGAFPTIQAAINASVNGDLITIAPGNYNEALILDKRVRLQGWGAGSTFINPIINTGPAPVAWRALLDSKAAAGTFDMLPGQTTGINPATGLPSLLGAEEQSGVLVLGKKHPTDPNIGCANVNVNSALRVDGLAITGSITGGGIFANGYACGLQVSNNRVFSNSGTFGGGVRIGHTALVAGTAYVDAVNRNVNMHHNWIAENGSIAVGAAGAESGGGGGITLGTGSNNYTVASNYICGNFSLADGAGVSHVGRSPTTAGTSNTIAGNTIIFNQSFDQDALPRGAGLSIAAPLPPAGGTAAGTGDVTVNANLFQGNQAGTGPGAAVSIARTLAADDVVLTNNMIVNNVTGYAGAVALSSVTANVRLVNNTIANNVSTATSRQAFGAGIGAPTSSQIAGLALLDGPIPTLLNNIFWGNRSYIFVNSGGHTALCNPGTTSLDAAGTCLPTTATPSYRDLGALAGAGPLEPRYSVLSDNTENQAYMGNNQPCTNTAPSGQATRCNRLEPVPASIASTPLFVKANDFTDSLKSAATVDEGGNFVSVVFSPLTLWDIDATGNVLATLRADYHIKAGAIAVNNGRNNGGANGPFGSSYVPAADFDAQTRVNPIDIGADEIASAAPPALTSINPTSGAQGATGLVVNFVGTNLAGATAVTVSGTGVTCSVTGSTATTVTASCNITAVAAIGVRTVTVTTPAGTSGTVNFTVVGSLKSITGLTVGGPNSGGGGSRLVTVTVIAHGYATGNHVAITGVTPPAYNGTKTITATGVNTFTYTVGNGTGNVTSFAGAQAQLVP